MTNQKHQKWIKWSPCLFILIFIYSSCSNCLIVPTDNHPDTCKTVTIVLQHLHKNTKFNNHDLKLVLYRDVLFNFKEVLCPHPLFSPNSQILFFRPIYFFCGIEILFFKHTHQQTSNVNVTDLNVFVVHGTYFLGQLHKSNTDWNIKRRKTNN